MKHKGYNNVVNSLGNSTAQKFGFEGVELEESLGLNLHEMDFRQYDASIGRFTGIDAMAEERDWLNPYNFVQNNPILRVDPSGLLDDYGLDTDTGQLVFLKATNDDTDTVYTGDTYVDNNGEMKFDKDGKSSKTFKKGSSNIKELTTKKDENGNVVSNGESVDSQGLIFSEGNLQTGLELMQFVSVESGIELNAWGFETDKGQGLYISPWSGNDGDTAIDDVSADSNNVVTSKLNLGKKIGNVHTHPLSSNNYSRQDKQRRNTSKNKNFPFYIITEYGDWYKY